MSRNRLSRARPSTAIAQRTEHGLALPPAASPGPAEDVEARSSLERGARPRPGMRRPAYRWGDVLREPPPRTRREASYVVYHATEVDDDVRIAHSTLVEVLASDGRSWLRADARVSVQRRTLLEQMDALRAASARRARRQRQAWGRFLAWQSRRARALPGRRASRWAARCIRAEARAGLAVIDALHRFALGLVQVPDALAMGAMRAEAHLATRIGRRGLWASVRAPERLDAEEKGALLFLTLLGAALAVLALNSFFALAWPEAAGVYRAVLGNALLQFASVLGVPVVIEPLFLLAVLTQGPALALLAFGAGKLLAVWALYLAGDALHDRWARKPGRLTRALERLRRGADRWGFAVLVLDNALPLMPDQVLLLFAVSGMRFRTWLAGIALGTALKFALLLGLLAWAGPERASAWLAHPLG